MPVTLSPEEVAARIKAALLQANIKALITDARISAVFPDGEIAYFVPLHLDTEEAA